MRISDWSSDVCSSDLGFFPLRRRYRVLAIHRIPVARMHGMFVRSVLMKPGPRRTPAVRARATGAPRSHGSLYRTAMRSEEHTSELQSLMRISYTVFCLKKKKNEHSAITQKNNCTLN